MAIKTLLTACLAVAFVGTATASDMPATWDGLTEYKAKKLDAIYLLPGADFRAYDKVMVDSAEIAFRKDWLRNINSSMPVTQRHLTDADAKKMLDGAKTNFDQVFVDTLKDSGFTIVSEAGPGVLRLSPGVANLYVNAPDPNRDSMARTYVMEAGEGTLVLEARDSLTNALLGRVLDRRETANSGRMQFTNQSSNIADFRALVKVWANTSAKGLEELKAQSPVPAQKP